MENGRNVLRSVLVVDDDSAIREYVSKAILTLGNWEVREASCAEEALDLCHLKRFDVVLTDYDMPGMTGGELAAQLRKELSSKEGPGEIVLMTGYSGFELRRVQPNISRMIHKPFLVKDLVPIFG